MPAKSPLSTVNKVRQVHGLYLSLAELKSLQIVRQALLTEREDKRTLQISIDEGKVLEGNFLISDATLEALEGSGLYRAESVEGMKIAKTVRHALAPLTGESQAAPQNFAEFARPIDALLHPETGDLNPEVDEPEELSARIEAAFRQSQEEPVFLYNVWKRYRGVWMYQGFLYTSTGPYAEADHKLLIQESFDRERRALEKLRAKFHPREGEARRSRPRIPEAVRIEVWNRDGGKCARCGSRTNLEYDHIVPLSKGGSNTARNIELLCEKCNRLKGDAVA